MSASSVRVLNLKFVPNELHKFKVRLDKTKWQFSRRISGKLWLEREGMITNRVYAQ